MEDTCTWRYNKKRDIWESDCKREWIPTETSYPIVEMNYCVFCGMKVIIDKECNE